MLQSLALLPMTVNRVTQKLCYSTSMQQVAYGKELYMYIVMSRTQSCYIMCKPTHTIITIGVHYKIQMLTVQRS